MKIKKRARKIIVDVTPKPKQTQAVIILAQIT